VWKREYGQREYLKILSVAHQLRYDTINRYVLCFGLVITNNAVTKDFLEQQAKKLAPGYRRRSGARYRLNRWREEQLANGVAITYRDVVKEYVRLSQSTERFARVPHGRYINFMSDFLAHEAGATTADASAAWHVVKSMDCPKTYRAWRSRR